MTGDVPPTDPSVRALVEDLCSSAFPGRHIVEVRDAGGGRGVFSAVLRVGFDDGSTAVAKLPGPNRGAAIAMGAFERERLAYTALLPHSPVRAPRCHLVRDLDDGAVAFLLEDVGGLRRVDQADGLGPGDAAVVAASLAPMHRFWQDRLDDGDLATVRRHAPATFDHDALVAGLGRARSDWGDELDLEPLAERLRRRDRWVDRFVAADATLCHGDARADNLVFDDTADGGPVAVLFDWQQLSVQTPGADLAWLLATSARPDRLESTVAAVVDAYANAASMPRTTIEDGLAVGALHPSSAVLLLAGRDTPDPATRALVRRSLERIAAFVALVDGN